jgi:hypothetical protein
VEERHGGRNGGQQEPCKISPEPIQPVIAEPIIGQAGRVRSTLIPWLEGKRKEDTVGGEDHSNDQGVKPEVMPLSRLRQMRF